MKTTLRIGETREARTNCSTISPVERLDLKPIVPVAQNLQPILQPTWDETHRVDLTPPERALPLYFPKRVSYFMITASTSDPL